MLLPLYDENPKSRIRYQYVTLMLVIVCGAAFLWQQSMGQVAAQKLILGLGAIPAVVFGYAELPPELFIVPSEITLLSSMFLHGGWMHLIGNMLFLWVLGDNVEDTMGHKRFVAFYVLCGLAAALAHAALDPHSKIPMIGASGAISGVIGAYLLLHPKAPIHTLVFYFVIAIPAWIVLGLWIGIQLFNILQDGGGNVAWWAHIGGLLAGIILIPLFKYKDVPLLSGVKGNATKPANPPPRGIRLMRRAKKPNKTHKSGGPWG
ncbi:MAG: rhomboid family intramembrane serine protease [Rhodospirillales bacterium]|jgi:membrane associated rhomboid family serine protease|nr:rhomboid family intramembrane serine protease [Rhodospirillales bacterium]